MQWGYKIKIQGRNFVDDKDEEESKTEHEVKFV